MTVKRKTERKLPGERASKSHVMMASAAIEEERQASGALIRLKVQEAKWNDCLITKHHTRISSSSY